jgi:uncharacterized protein
MNFDDIPLVHNEAHHSFEIKVEGHRAFIDYIKNDNSYFLIHTEVPADLQGQGIAGALVDKTFRWLDENNFKMRPFCPYVQSYLKRHPEWSRLEG